MNKPIKIMVGKGENWVDLIFAGGQEFDIPGEYAITISRESLLPFAIRLQKFAEDESTGNCEMFFDLPEGAIENDFEEEG